MKITILVKFMSQNHTDFGCSLFLPLKNEFVVKIFFNFGTAGFV